MPHIVQKYHSFARMHKPITVRHSIPGKIRKSKIEKPKKSCKKKWFVCKIKTYEFSI